VKLAALLFAVTACGRIDFQTSEPGGGGGGDGGGSGSGNHIDAAKAIDAPSSVCAQAMTVVVAGISKEINTCQGPDMLDGCGPPGTKEAVLVFIPPASAGYNARAYDHGTMNITMVSTTVLDSTCGNASNCAAFLGTTYTQDVPAYFVLEASSGGCADVDFLVD
jgi:hypothetical protein